MEAIIQDIRYGIQMMRRHPGVTMVAILALAIGIGANTAIFSVVQSVLIRPLPYKNADRLVQIWGQNPARGVPFHNVPYPDLNQWREQSRSYEAMSAYRNAPMNLTGRDQPEQILTLQVNAEFFAVAGVPPLHGRTISAEEDRPGSGRVLMLTFPGWRRLFGADPAIVGRSIFLNANSYTVIGIMPASFALGGSAVDAYVPLATSGDYQPGNMMVSVAGYARLKPGITRQQAQAELDVINRRLEQEHPPGRRNGRIWGVQEFLVRDVHSGLLILMGAVAFVLLISCTNVANILLARAGARRREMALRTVMGASRGRLVRQMLTESVLLALVGGLLGTGLAFIGVKILVSASGRAFPLIEMVALDKGALLFTGLVCLLTGLLAGLAPARAVLKEGAPGFLQQSLKDGGRSLAGSYSGRRLRAVLVTCEVALACMLLVGAGLFMRSLIRLQEVDPGFSEAGVLTARVTLPSVKYGQGPSRRVFFQEFLSRLESSPDVIAAGLVTMLPLSGSNTGLGIFIEGRPEPPQSEIPIVWWRAASPGYFPAMSIPLLRGRLLTEADKESAPAVAVINKTMARRIWPGEDPIGKRFSLGRAPQGDQPSWLEVVGVVGDVRHTNLAQEPDAEFFLPAVQMPPTSATVVIKTRTDPMDLVPYLRKAALEVDKDMPVSAIRSMEQIMSDSIYSRQLAIRLMAIFAGIALVLAAIGIYGVVSYSVGQRTHEIGVRIALGARAGQVLRMTIVQGMAPVFAGLVLGIGGALATVRLIRSQLFETDPRDPAIFVSGLMVLLLVAVLATLIPARRAAQVDPIVALRRE